MLQPERIKPDPESPGYNVKSDVWSLGITLVNIVFSLLNLQTVCLVEDDISHLLIFLVIHVCAFLARLPELIA